MKTSSASLLAFAALLTTAAADGASTWLQWSSSAPAPAPAPVTWTDWETSYSTIYKTVDNYITVIETPKPVTVTVTATATQVSVSVSGSVATVVNTVVNTVVPPAVTVTVTSVGVSVSVVSSVSTVTSTVTVTSVSRSVTTAPAPTGITTCETRTKNPTYTTSTPLPTDYLWGCPPGTICTPPRIDCNFEQNPPSKDYYCSPDQCKPVKPLPDVDVLIGGAVNASCAFLTPVDGYFNVNPQFFGLDYNVYNIYGNPVCPIIEKVYITVTTTVVSGTTVAITLPTTIVEYSNVPTTVVNTVVNTEYSKVPVPTTIVQVSNIPVPTTVVEYETVTASSSWAAWNSKVTKRAELEARDLEERDQPIYFASACIGPCNAAALWAQNIGLVSTSLCVPNGQFSRGWASFQACTRSNPIGAANPQPVSTVGLADAVNLCGYPILKRTAAAEPSAPAFRFARG